jgi:hypothetical protein
MSETNLSPNYSITNKLNAPGFSVTNRSESSGSPDLSEFRDLLTLMMMGFGSQMSGAGLSGLSTGSMPGMDLNSMIAPLMLGLLEKMLSQQVEENQPEAAGEYQRLEAPGDTKVWQGPEDETSGSGKVPHGMPIKGYLTQASRSGHVALDFGAPVGTPVKATMHGRVVYAGWNNEGYGNLVIVDNGKYRTYYAHLSKIPVKVGHMVKQGETIALSGNTGNSTGPHLHYEVRQNGRQMDPAGYIGKAL